MESCVAAIGACELSERYCGVERCKQGQLRLMYSTCTRSYRKRRPAKAEAEHLRTQRSWSFTRYQRASKRGAPRFRVVAKRGGWRRGLGRKVGKGVVALASLTLELASHVSMKTSTRRCNNSSSLLKKNGTAVFETNMGAANSARANPGGNLEMPYLR